MEAIAGLSLAANILQVVEFTANVLSAGRQISQAGSTVQNSELGVVVTDFTALNDRVKIWARPDPAALGPLAENGQALENLAVESGKIAKELISLLESLRAKPEASRYKTVSQAIRTVWSANKIDGLRNRLQTIRDELQFRILVSIREDQIQGVDEAGRKALQSVLDSNKALDTKMTAQTTEITRRQETEGQLAAQRHDEVLGAISRQRITTIVLEDVTETIKSELFFTRKDDRFEDIAVAHQQTFQWALEDTTPADWPSLVEWLRESSSVYWIAGKAGSGKSILMKYLYQDSRMSEALKNWAGEKRLIILDFYFWNSGAGIQKSQEGLFRSLLWQVLDQDPTFGSLLFPEQYFPGARWTEFPTFHQLRRAFGRLTRQRHDATKIAMIIDGLDEFDANRVTMSELAEMFLAATKQDNIKALLSSRPLTAFEDAFLD
ncbi:hypothetical protein EKO04_004561 [Ascochyta lentis]|uniref:Nephrocystin 3-like N-terminal domain-containing protein n=1 Tax=Ascochyta lentis TaxID=205686 RepID=A0A8H7J5D6_9PLEO|nr:hypothetical protein EKO04_004561 [Ascochyta lentis]